MAANRPVWDPDISYDRNWAQLLRFVAEQSLKSVKTALPGEVIAVDGNRVDVQPLIDMLIDDGTSMPRAPILNVPVLRPGGGGWTIHAPIAVGDQVLVVFCHRDIGGWQFTGQQGAPPSDRIMSETDAIALPVFTSDLLSGVGVTIESPDGNTSVRVGDGRVEIDARQISLIYDGGRVDYP